MTRKKQFRNYEAEAAILLLERAEDAAGAVTDAESRLKAAQVGVTRAEEVQAAADNLDLVVFTASERDAGNVGEWVTGGAGLTVPLTIYRGDVVHDPSGQTRGTWHTCAECAR